MKLRQLATAFAVAAALAAPAFAADSSGSVGVSASNADDSYTGLDAESRAYTLDGSIALKASDSWTVTLGGSVSRLEGDLYDYAPSDTGYALSAAVTYGGDDWRFGPFAATQDMAYDGIWTVGGVAETYLGDLTLGGAVAHNANDLLDIKAWSVSGEARYFLRDNLFVRGGGSWMTIDAPVLGGEGLDAWTLGVGAEYQFTGTRWSVFGGYDHGELEDAQRDSVKLGVRVNFGGDLKARVRSGADLPITSPLGGLPLSL